MVVKTYIGRSGLGGPTVLVEEDGATRPLPHHVRHSPDGFNWGYGGSGPSDLARSLLIDFFGQEADCPECERSGQLEDEPGHMTSCWECGGDGFKLPVGYQDFKFQVIAGLPSAGWTLSEEKVAEWVRAQDDE
jgi:hypothetical protein